MAIIKAEISPARGHIRSAVSPEPTDKVWGVPRMAPQRPFEVVIPIEHVSVELVKLQKLQSLSIINIKSK